MARSPANRRYNIRVLALSVIYASLLFAAVYGFKHHLLTGVIAWVVAILPAIAIIGIFVSIGLYLVEERDEYLRALMVRQTLWASGFALSIATVWGFLENFGLARHVDSYWGAISWFAGLGIGRIANKLTIGRG